jgi:Peptidase family M23/Fibronectin type III domain
MSRSRFAILLAIVALLAGAPPAQAATPPARPDLPVVGPGGAHIVKADDQIVKPGSTGRRAAAAANAGPAPFLTRPYWDFHAVTSVFDHCNPDYSRDGRICEVDGTVATAANGVDPTFSAGYATTPGGRDYLYYDGHNGWDIALNYENLIAAADGVVNLAGCDPNNGGCGAGFGLTVTINHPNGITTRYGHMSQIWVSPGQVVQRGQGIGVSGNTGASTGPHLHFGVYLTASWTAIDPWGWEGGYPDPWPSDVGNLWLTGNPQNPVPWSPQGLTATAGWGSATVSWTPPAFDGGTGVAHYTVTAAPGGASVEVPGTQNSAVIAGLVNGTTYTFTATATNAYGTSPTSPASNAVMPTGLKITNPATSSTTDFDISWTGPGATGYDVAYREDGRPFVPWLTNVAGTSAHFYGLAGHAFRFQVSSRSAAGTDISTSGPTSVGATAATPFGVRAAYTVDQFGSVRSYGSLPVDPRPIWNWDIGRALAVLPSGDGGYILDG